MSFEMVIFSKKKQGSLRDVSETVDTEESSGNVIFVFLATSLGSWTANYVFGKNKIQ